MSSCRGRCVFLLVASWVLPLSTFLGSRGSLFLCLHNFIYWFAESSLLRGLFSAAAIRGYSLGTVLGLLNVVASLVVAHRLGCSMACGIFPDQGSNPCTPYWQADSLSLSHQGSPAVVFYILFLWLHWVLVAPCGISNLHCSVQGL